jgi:hypothetical protein
MKPFVWALQRAVPGADLEPTGLPARPFHQLELGSGGVLERCQASSIRRELVHAISWHPPHVDRKLSLTTRYDWCHQKTLLLYEKFSKNYSVDVENKEQCNVAATHFVSGGNR